jgi:hypothetical protein
MTDAVAECEPCCGTGYTDYAARLDLGSEAQSTPDDEAGIKPAPRQSTSNDE